MGIDADHLAVRAGGDVYLSDAAGGLSIGTVDGIAGITTGGSDVVLSTAGDLSILAPIAAGGRGEIRLSATGALHVGANITDAGADDRTVLSAGGLVSQAAGTLISTQRLWVNGGGTVGTAAAPLRWPSRRWPAA